MWLSICFDVRPYPDTLPPLCSGNGEDSFQSKHMTVIYIQTFRPELWPAQTSLHGFIAPHSASDEFPKIQKDRAQYSNAGRKTSLLHTSRYLGAKPKSSLCTGPLPVWAFEVWGETAASRLIRRLKLQGVVARPVLQFLGMMMSPHFHYKVSLMQP